MTEKKTTKAADDEAAVLAKVAAWPEPYRAIGQRIHEIILGSVPELRPRLWYGMPGYAKGGPVLCFFRADEYISFGLTEKATLSVDNEATDQLIGSAWFLTTLDEATEERITTIVRKAAS